MNTQLKTNAYVGCIVHYVTNEEKPRHLAAMVTKVYEEGLVDLAIFTEHSSANPPIIYKSGVIHDDDHSRSSWHRLSEEENRAGPSAGKFQEV